MKFCQHEHNLWNTYTTVTQKFHVSHFRRATFLKTLLFKFLKKRCHLLPFKNTCLKREKICMQIDGTTSMGIVQGLARTLCCKWSKSTEENIPLMSIKMHVNSVWHLHSQCIRYTWGYLIGQRIRDRLWTRIIGWIGTCLSIQEWWQLQEVWPTEEKWDNGWNQSNTHTNQ